MIDTGTFKLQYAKHFFLRLKNFSISIFCSDPTMEKNYILFVAIVNFEWHYWCSSVIILWPRLSLPLPPPHQGLNIVDLEDLLEDIKVYSEIEVDAANINFWRDITLVCEDEITQLKKVEDSMGGEMGGARGGAGRRAVINPSVLTEVNSVFKGKTVRLCCVPPHRVCCHVNVTVARPAGPVGGPDQWEDTRECSRNRRGLLGGPPCPTESTHGSCKWIKNRWLRLTLRAYNLS